MFLLHLNFPNDSLIVSTGILPHILELTFPLISR